MNKTLKVLILSLLIISLFVSCSTTSSSKRDEIVRYVKKTGNTRIGADGSDIPSWITSDLSTYDVHFAVGYSRAGSSAENAVKQAQLEACEELNTWLSDNLRNIKSDYSRVYNDDAFGGTKEVNFIDDFCRTVSVSFRKNFLPKVTYGDVWKDSKNGVWVLAYISVPELRDMLYDTADNTRMDQGILMQSNRLSLLKSLIDDFFPPEPFDDFSEEVVKK